MKRVKWDLKTTKLWRLRPSKCEKLQYFNDVPLFTFNEDNVISKSVEKKRKEQWAWEHTDEEFDSWRIFVEEEAIMVTCRELFHLLTGIQSPVKEWGKWTNIRLQKLMHVVWLKWRSLKVEGHSCGVVRFHLVRKNNVSSSICQLQTPIKDLCYYSSENR